jgi:hypothetical protein
VQPSYSVTDWLYVCMYSMYVCEYICIN